MAEQKVAGLIGWFASNHVAANLLMFLILLAGGYSAYTIKLEAFPEFNFDLVTVRVPYLGAAPQEVEEGVLIKIEEALKSITGVRKLTSIAFEGMGRVMVEIEDGYSVNEMLGEVKLAVDGISTFPAETERPIISKQRFRDSTIVVQVAGIADEAAMQEFAEEIRDDLIALPEISYAEVQGGRPFEISVEISEATLRQYNLTLEEVARVIRQWSVDLPGGTIRTAAGNIRLRTKGQAYTGAEFEKILLLTRPDGTRIRLGDVATVVDGFVEVESYAFFNGARSLGVDVFSSDEESEIEVSAAVHRYLDERRASLPPGIEIELWRDKTYYLKGQLNMMLKNLAIGALLVFLILGLFLHIKIAAWVSVGLPVAFLGAIMLLQVPFIDVSINMISLFGFILVLGIVVDDAIVIAESAYTETEEKGYSLANIVVGAQRVAVPATFGVLTTIMTFLPMLFVTGPVSTFAASIGWVVVLCLTFSLVESKLILPSHLALMRSSHAKEGIADAVDRALKRFIENTYLPLLTRAMEFRYATLAFFIGLLILAVGLVLGGQIRYTGFPEVDGDFISANVELLDGAPESLIKSIVNELDAQLQAVNEELKAETGSEIDIVKHSFAYIRNGTSAQLTVELEKSEHRSVTPQEVEKRWRERTGEIAGTKELKFESTRHTGGGPPIAFRLQAASYSQLELAAEELADHLRTYDGLFEINSSANLGPEEISLRIKPEAEALGVTLAGLARQVRQAFYGAEAQRIQRGEQEVKVMVRYPRSERRSIGNLENMWIRTSDGRELPFRAVADYSMARGFNSIQRINGERTITVSSRADLNAVEPLEIIGEITAGFIPGLQSRYRGLRVDLDGAAHEERLALDQILLAFALAMFGVYALLAIPLKSYLQPLIIMGVIPFGIVGALVGHMLLDISISMMSLIGIVALSGVVVNDSLIMVDYVNRSVSEGMKPIQAALRSGAARFRAILLTSLTTFFGLTPVVFERSLQAQLVIPMAVSLAFGILFATLITLVLVPCLYMIIGDLNPRRVPADADAKAA